MKTALSNRTFTSTCVFALFAGMLSLAVPRASAQSNFTFTSFDVSGASTTIAHGINNKGDIVGQYVDSTGVHGFLLRDGQLTTLDHPEAVGRGATILRGINARGDIAGLYVIEGINRSFVRDVETETFTPVDAGLNNTVATRITDEGKVIGCFHRTLADGTFDMPSMQGFILENGVYNTLDIPGTMHNGISPDGQTLVGQAFGLDERPGDYGYFYVPATNAYNTFDFPDAIHTQAKDINAQGEVVGLYRDQLGTFHGFLLQQSDAFSSIDFPEAVDTRAWAINSEGTIVGVYTDVNGTQHAFVAGRN